MRPYGVSKGTALSVILERLCEQHELSEEAEGASPKVGWGDPNPNPNPKPKPKPKPKPNPDPKPNPKPTQAELNLTAIRPAYERI